MDFTKEEMTDILNSCAQIVQAVNAKISNGESVDDIIISRKYYTKYEERYINDHETRYVVEQRTTTLFNKRLFAITFEDYYNGKAYFATELKVGNDYFFPNINAPLLYNELDRYWKNKKLKEAEQIEQLKKIWQAEAEKEHKKELRKVKTFLGNAVKTL